MHEDTGISTAVAELPPDLALIKMENESIQALAAARPRSMVTIKQELVTTLDAFPAFAEQLMYAKPCGKDPETGEQKIARGLSVRAAEALAEAYGFNRVRSEVTELPDDRVKVEATFVDFQRGRIWQDAGIVSKWFRRRNGQMERIADDRFYGVVVKAEASRRIREVVNRSVNAGLKAWLWDEACKRCSKLLDDKAVNKILGHFRGLGVTQDEIERFLGVPASAGWTEQHRLDLMGAWQAIQQGEETVESMFRSGDHQAPKTTAPLNTGTDEALKKPEVRDADRPGNDPKPKARGRKPKPESAGEESQVPPEPTEESSQESGAPAEQSRFFTEWLGDLHEANTTNKCGALLQSLLAAQKELLPGELEQGKDSFRRKTEAMRAAK